MMKEKLPRKTVTVKKITLIMLTIAAFAPIILATLKFAVVAHDSGVIIADSRPDFFSEIMDFRYYHGTLDVVSSHEAAAAIARTHMRTIYNQTFHGPFTVFLDEETRLYFVSSGGGINPFSTSIHMVIDKFSGAVIAFSRERF
jgi:hypothetical protein